MGRGISKYANDPNYYFDEKSKIYRKKDDRIDCYKFISVFWYGLDNCFYVYDDEKDNTLCKELPSFDEFINYLLIRKKPHVHFIINNGDKLANFLLRNKVMKEEKRKKKVYNIDEDRFDEFESFIKYRLTNKNAISIHSLERLIPNKADLDVKVKEDRELLREVTLRFIELGDFTHYTAGSISFYNLQRSINEWNTPEHIKQQKNIAYAKFEYRSLDFQYKVCKYDKDKQEDFNHPYWKYRNQIMRIAYFLGPNMINKYNTQPNNTVKELKHVYIYDRSSAFPYQQAYELMPYGLPKMINCNKEIVYIDNSYNLHDAFKEAEEYIRNNRKNSTCVLYHVTMKWERGRMSNFRDPDNDILHIFDNIKESTVEEFLENKKNNESKGHAYISRRTDKYIYVSTFVADNDLLTIAHLYHPNSIIIDFEMVFNAKLTDRRDYILDHYNNKEEYKKLLEEEAKKGYKVNLILEKLMLNCITRKDGSKKDEYNQYYSPLAIFTTSGNRKDILHFAHYNPNYLLYCDTDSIHTTLNPEQMEKTFKDTNSSLEIGKGLGKLKIEAYDVEAKYVGKKHYAYRDKDGKEKIVLSQGLSKEFTKAFVNFDNVDTLRLTKKQLDEYNRNKEYEILVYQDPMDNIMLDTRQDDTVIVDLTAKRNQEIL